MKKLLSILLVLALVLSLSVTAFAAGETGSITITNATVDETYAVYKIFDATISKDALGVTEAVSYSITPDNQFFKVLFGADGKTANPYFVYNANTGTVTKVEGANDSDLVKYLTDLVAGGTYTKAADPIKAASKEVKFDGLAYGYYLITSTLGATVTINSNTPDVSVIDKNQEPGNEFDKLIWDDEKNAWKESNSANIGDEVTYKIEFEATNYDGDKQIKYYRITDEKGDGIWADFESFEVYVGGVKLDRGYYLDQGANANGDWEFLGDWSAIPESDRDANDAQWYLVHLTKDSFRITIPWLENHKLTVNAGSYVLDFPVGAASKFDSPVDVKIIYDAVIQANAAIGGTTHGNRFNKASASWTSEYETGSTTPEEVVTYVYGLGLLKDDSATGQNLAGAKFRIYSDVDCTKPVYIIPTDIAGVYIRDSKDTPLEDITGEGKKTSRDLYASYLAAYLGTNTQDNYAVSQVNGKLVILGLEAGTYYLKEVEAPDGYNALTAPIALKAGEGSKPFTIFANGAGEVADIQMTDGVYTEKNYDVTSTVVHNSKGVQLPSTGGKGTIMLITFGTLIAVGFAVLLITQKKMSVYHD